MKIAATVTECRQVGIEHWAWYSKTKVFESTSSLDDILSWARTVYKHADFNDIQLTICDE